MSDPMEAMISEALGRANLPFDVEIKGLDFSIPSRGAFIEVKQFHSDRIADQMSRVTNVIAAQGSDAVRWLAELIGQSAPLEVSRAQLRSSTEEIGRLTKALRRLAEFPADDAGLSDGALSKYWKQRMDTAREIARAALATSTTETKDGH